MTARDGPVRLDVGGGSDPADGWLNVDPHADEADLRATATDLPFDDESVAAIRCVKTWFHIPDVAAAMREWHRVLEPGGTVTIVENPGETIWSTSDPDHEHHQWSVSTVRWFEDGHERSYYYDFSFEVLSVEPEFWLTPDRWWLRPLSFAAKHLARRCSVDVVDQLYKLPFASGTITVVCRKPATDGSDARADGSGGRPSESA